MAHCLVVAKISHLSVGPKSKAWSRSIWTWKYKYTGTIFAFVVADNPVPCVAGWHRFFQSILTSHAKERDHENYTIGYGFIIHYRIIKHSICRARCRRWSSGNRWWAWLWLRYNGKTFIVHSLDVFGNVVCDQESHNRGILCACGCRFFCWHLPFVFWAWRSTSSFIYV